MLEMSVATVLEDLLDTGMEDGPTDCEEVMTARMTAKNSRSRKSPGHGNRNRAEITWVVRFRVVRNDSQVKTIGSLRVIGSQPRHIAPN